jgi:hypothetical protein
MLSPRAAPAGRPPAPTPVAHCTLPARRLLLLLLVMLLLLLLLLPGPGPASDRVCLRAHAGILSSGLLPCNSSSSKVCRCCRPAGC